MNKEVIVLIGMPGSGKTTVGRILAQRMGVEFVDTDRLIQEIEGMPLSEIQQTKGMSYFIKAEEAALLSVDDSPKVVATGGSAVLCEHAMMYLCTIARIVFLDVDLNMLQRRIKDPKKRGVVLAPRQTIAGVYFERRPLYLRYAEIRIRAKHTRPREVADMICRRIGVEVPSEPEERMHRDEKHRPLIEKKDGERKNGEE